jgi:hypothetical protein
MAIMNRKYFSTAACQKRYEGDYLVGFPVAEGRSNRDYLRSFATVEGKHLYELFNWL